MSLELAHKKLSWPQPSEVFEPMGAGARVIAELAQQKLGKAISSFADAHGVRVGILANDPLATEAPLAIVCDFPNPVSEATLLATQRLAWNFSRSLLLITIEPHVIRKWSCCETPVDDVIHSQAPRSTPEILPPIFVDKQNEQLQEHAAASLHWIELVSGHFFQREAARFPRDQRADRMLLSNLKEVRKALRGMGLDDRYSHDLLARIIFVQFLFDRKDSSNRAALDAEKLSELHKDGVLHNTYTDLAGILSNYEDTYALFKWLNSRFNGDLFPGKGQTLAEQEAEWREEQLHVGAEHLELLALFVRGDMEMESGQKCLWPMYAFDAIPLEFISSIYEEFVSKDKGLGIHYTPSHLVDLMLDRVLPWFSEEWNLKILDPACGSGIFLVKAYQRLIYRWKYAQRNSGNEAAITPDVLKELLERNLFGVDSDRHAVRVASFSLYLAMCDEIDPRSYWSRPDIVFFPPLRTKRIIHSDFFAEDVPGFRTTEDAGLYDIIIGNPPWGDTTLTPCAIEWYKNNHWDIANKDMGILFATKSASLVRENGLVCLVQSTSALLFNNSPKAVAVRHKLFLNFKRVENVVNLAALQIFQDVRVPTCVLTFRNTMPDGGAFLYECPKPLRTSEDINRITIESQDIHAIYPDDIVTEPWIWSVLMWGGNRDRALMRRLKRYPNLEELKEKKVVTSRLGIMLGNRKKRVDNLLGRKHLAGAVFPTGSERLELFLRAEQLQSVTDPYIHSKDSPNLEAFELPQLLIKTSWVKKAFRFQARLVVAPPNGKGIVCSRSFISVHLSQPQEGNTSLLEACCICYNSDFANYYLLLSSGNLAFDRTEPRIEDTRRLPIPDIAPGMNVLAGLDTMQDVNKRVIELFGFQEVESILIDDLNKYTLPDFKLRHNSPGRQPTHRHAPENADAQNDPELYSYADILRRVLKSAYGKDKLIGANIFSDHPGSKLPVRMVAIYLNSPDVTSVEVMQMTSTALREKLTNVYNVLSLRGNHSYQRCLRIYDHLLDSPGDGLVVYIIKPDQIRYWTRSRALRDADDIAADLHTWAVASQSQRNGALRMRAN